MSRLCVVTGGSRGIGRSVVHRMAAEGYEVMAIGRDEAALRETAESSSAPIQIEVLDVTDHVGVRDLFGKLAVDVLVNNAGVAVSAPVQKTSLADWEHALRVNATGPFLCISAVLPGMLERGWGRIVTVASIGSHVGSPYLAAYTASKHAVLGLTRTVAAEVAGSGVTANVVCPAYVDTPMTEASLDRITSYTGLDRETALGRLGSMTLLGRLLDPEEVAHAVAFLASEESGAINGTSVVLHGGGTRH